MVNTYFFEGKNNLQKTSAKDNVLKIIISIINSHLPNEKIGTTYSTYSKIKLK